MSSSFSTHTRTQILQDLSKQPLDLLVIGGGITGAGIALDAVTRGMQTGLLEMQDFAAGTSSRSTKLIHGGLRYLKQLEIKLVAETGRERRIVYENGPHVTKAEPMLLPLVSGGSLSKWSASIGLAVYDWLAKVPRSEQRQMLSADKTQALEPLLDKHSLLGGAYYYEYRTDDARLTIEVLKEAVARSGKAVNYTQVTGFIYKEGKLVGVQAKDLLSNTTYEIFAHVIVNATGPWIDTLDTQNDPTTGNKLFLTKGVHLVVDGSRLPIRQAVYFDVPDGRMIFAIPREGKTYIGTTDTAYTEAPVHPRMTTADRDYLLQAVNYMFPSIHLTSGDVESHWVGVRPLIRQPGKGPSEISRKDEIFQYESGLITIAGGKLTGYRKMAERIVNLAAIRLKQQTGRKFPACQTHHLPISGGQVGGSKGFASYIQEKIHEGVALGLTPTEAEELAHFYGSNTSQVFHYLPPLSDNPQFRILQAQLQYAITHEMTVTPADFLIRRTGALYFHIDWVRQWEQTVWEYMAQIFFWTPAQTQYYRQEILDRLEEASGVATPLVENKYKS